jgi:hypothetical protein
MVIEILPSNQIKIGELSAADGAILKIDDRPLTAEDYALITSKSIEYWRRFPTVSRLQAFLQSG